MSERKHVLLIATDHWPSALMGCAGHNVVMTPTLDTLAETGIRFTNYYSSCPVCIPARRSMMTGLNPKTHGDRVYSDQMRMPEVVTLAQAYRDAGYQAYAVGKLHVYPQRNRIGFDDVILQEEGRYEFGVVDDYQIWLGEHGYLGEEFMHCMGNNTYYTRPWHLPEEAHPTNWATKEMMKQIKRRDTDKPGFYYISYQFPHPPLVPLQPYLDMYDDGEIDEPVAGDWDSSREIMDMMSEPSKQYSKKEIRMAKKAFYAQCTHIDHQIRLLIGTLRECNMLDQTIIAFTSDHGDMLFDHGMVAKRCFYEKSANVPFILSGKPLECWKGTVEKKLGTVADLMPTLLDLCQIPIPETVEGIPLMSEQSHGIIYGEVGDGTKATRMVHDGRYKLIYYPYGNVMQMFDLLEDPDEKHDIWKQSKVKDVGEKLEIYLISQLYGKDLEWVRAGELCGILEISGEAKTDYGLYNQRGYHWPVPAGYENLGKNA